MIIFGLPNGGRDLARRMAMGIGGRWRCFASLKISEHSLSAAVREKIGPIQTSIAKIGEQQLHLSQTTECLSFTE